LARPFHLLRTRGAPDYVDPTEAELRKVEAELRNAGVDVRDYRVDSEAFAAFRARFLFPPEYHGGVNHGVYSEKLVEHFVAWNVLQLADEPLRWPYLDVAGASSPWAKLLREQGLEAFCIDLAPDPDFAKLDFYIKGDATRAPFLSASIGSASLQCAYEMFTDDSDTRLVFEFARILRPGGRVVISPLYTHTHPCFYQSVEYFGRQYGDADATAYLRRSAWNVPASRKYSSTTLRARVLDPARRAGLVPIVHVLRNKAEVGDDIYLHFFLTLDKPESTRAS
jgi:SAM-dependent methyltransferase